MAIAIVPNDNTTYNDQQNGQCSCVGTPCPASGTACNDGDPTTENDVADGKVVYS